MPPTKPRRRVSRRFNHLDALGGIELKAYAGSRQAGGADKAAKTLLAQAVACAVPSSAQPPSR